MNTKQGVLLVVSGPSGAGKGTICNILLEKNANLHLSVSVTTRDPRPGEIDGVHYFFRTKEEFRRMVEDNEFLEWATVYSNCYGTPVFSVREALEKGEDVLLEIDIQGALNVKKVFPDAVTVFITPPSLEILKKRLTDRGTEHADVLERRISAVRDELAFLPQYDYFVINDVAANAADRIASILAAEHFRTARNQNAHTILMEGKEL